ncbi:MAG: hypothetical protein ACR2QC_03915 [Gammaproteobacteria bacterium]
MHTKPQQTAETSKRPPPPNAPSQTGNPSGPERGNNPPAPKSGGGSPPPDIGAYVKQNC